MRPAECFCFSSALVFTYSEKKEKEGKRTFVIFAFRTKACFRGAIVLAPFFGPKTFCRLEDLAVPAAGLDLIAPCAIMFFFSVFEWIGVVLYLLAAEIRESVVRKWTKNLGGR
jgi:hypothetical protein